MKGDIDRIEGRPVVRFDRRCRFPKVSDERILILAGHPDGGFSRNFGFKGAANEEPFAHVLERDSRDERSMLRRNVDQLVVGEAADRRRNRKARDAKSPAKFRLVDQTAGLQSAGQNRLFQFAVDGFRLRMGALGQIPRPFPMSKRPGFALRC